MLNRWEENKVRWSISLHGTFIISSSEIEKKLCQAGEMEIWELTVTSNQTPSKTFRDICVKLNTTLLWIVVHLHVKKKNDSAHQGERTKRRQGSNGRGDNMTLGPSCWEAYKMPLPHTLTFEPTVRRRLAAHTSPFYNPAINVRTGSGRRPKSWSLHSHQILVAFMAIPGFVLGRETGCRVQWVRILGRNTEEAVIAFLITSFLSWNWKSEPSGYRCWISHTPGNRCRTHFFLRVCVCTHEYTQGPMQRFQRLRRIYFSPNSNS